MGEVELLRGELARREQEIGRQVAQAVALDLMQRGTRTLEIATPLNFVWAYVYSGEWIADCPSGCGNAEFVTGKHPRDRGVAGTRGAPYAEFVCSCCRYRCPISWPAEAGAISAVLDRRPVPHTRNWFPRGHALAVATGIPTGQSVDELLAENHDHGVH
ncbi:hypothetical protein BJF79_13870 [Actinomadura sp. CNU-125]|uniref:hypothetical protein n=1 Tax=Actinomadura sp. CNU-125 TaxID=1904961 RepID=UPI00095A6391|nr:hypothetical protein [Actinomadura sp. CNU-125]OLT24425.1 hypothetical protein BJF79_13870 [Actinomadura sp. CNU-125]